MKEDERATGGGQRMPMNRARRRAVGIFINCLILVIAMGFVTSELLEEGPIAKLLQQGGSPSEILHHFMALLAIPSLILFSYFYNKQQNLLENLEEKTLELKQSQEKLFESERFAAIGELATIVGHDLRNPLQSIENATYALNNELQRLPSSIPYHKKLIEMLQVIDNSVDYADNIVRDLQDFSKVSPPTLEKTDINTLVEKTLSQVEAPENVELRTDLDHLPEIKVDKDQMKRVFLNLATNGLQAMENGGTLTVSTKKTGGFVEVTFKDTGVGISEENMEKIFTPLFTTKAKGMGMGLAICKRFVDAHSGSIRVESTEGKGSTFTVKLPIQHEMEVTTIASK